MTAGAMTASLIGSGFATGQEIIQYFVAHSWQGILGIITTFITVAFMGHAFFRAGLNRKKDLSSPNDVFILFAGQKIGTIYKYLALVVLFLTYAVMVAGAGATIHQQFGIPVIIGSGIMYILSAGTVMLGLEKLTNILGNIGPAIAIIAILLGLAGFFMYQGKLGQANQLVQAALADETIHAASGNWLISALNYVGLIIMLNAGFLAQTGTQANTLKETKIAALLSSGIYAAGILILFLAFMAGFASVGGAQVPSLVIANDIHPFVSYLFIIIIMLAIYTTVVAMLWNVASSLATEGTKGHKWMTALVGLIATLIGLFLPFDQLVNIVYVVSGYFGIIFLFIMISKFCPNAPSRKINLCT
ncbi:hypothetical protein EF384_07550 [Aerococcus agrisoli]|uniref:Branched-chain amino acid transport system carrier protein n=1 Tax=Aerococcus agrisoli TaxID=2487350 RepID=A0A3N4GHX5_9LACT|nr:hypothetical protein EF384_07550 [Aerococcus agrisoli]